jgi:transcriptional regulator with XRE-family HTH domain
LKDVASAASISNPFLTLIEKGDRQPSLDVIGRIAKALAVPIETLILISQPDVGLKCTDDRATRILKSVERLADAEDALRRQLEGG